MVACISFVGVFVSSFVCPVCACLFLYCVLSVLSLYWVRLFLLSGSVFFVCRCLGGFFGSGGALSCRWVFLSCICLVSLLGVLFLYMVVVGSVAGVCVCWLSLWWVYVCLVFLCLGFVFLLYVWVPRFFVVLGFVFLVRFLGCLGVLVGVFLFFGGCRGFCFVGVVVFGVDFFYLVDVVLLVFVFLGAGFLCGWVLRFLCCVGRAVFVGVWFGCVCFSCMFPCFCV